MIEHDWKYEKDGYWRVYPQAKVVKNYVCDSCGVRGLKFPNKETIVSVSKLTCKEKTVKSVIK